MVEPLSIDTLTVRAAPYPGTWTVDADGITVTADTAADAVAIVHRALLRPGWSDTYTHIGGSTP